MVISELEHFTNVTTKTMHEAVSKCKSECISLSGGLDSSIITTLTNNKKIHAITINTKNFKAHDIVYAQQIANKFNINLDILTISVYEIILAINDTIKILKNFNDIEIRNAVAMYIVLKHIKNEGYNSIITGDGADELFFGYKFMLQKNMQELQAEFKRMLKIMHFPILKLGKSLNIKIETPFLHNNVIELAKIIPNYLKINENNNIKYGKWILRKSFEKKIPNTIIWRIKSPIQEGSGTSNLTNFFNSFIDDDLYTKKSSAIYKNDNIIIRSKESLYYYEIFKKYCKLSNSPSNNKEICPHCCYPKKIFSKFCAMCGSFPI